MPALFTNIQRCFLSTTAVLLSLGSVAVFGTSTAVAQSGSRIYSPPRSSYPAPYQGQPGSQAQYPAQGSGTIIQSSPIQGSGSAVRGSTTVQGSSTVQGSATMQGSTVRGSDTGSSSRPMMSAPKEAFESKFWRYLNDARYREWAPVSGTDGDAYPGESPHGAMLKMYLNRKVAGLPDKLPVGSVVVKENYGPDGKTLMAVTTMYKPKNYDSGGTTWYWTKYNPDGSVATKDGQRLAGKVQGCIDCHSGAEGGDYAFFND